MAEAPACSAGGSSRADLRRLKIIETARKLFIERGFHATGVAQIARESGIAVGQMYRDFAAKEDIVAALVERDCASFMRADTLKDAIDNRDSDRIMAWLMGFLEPDDDREGRALFAEIVAESARNERIAGIFTTIQLELRALILAALAQLAPDPARAAQRAILADILLTFSLGLLHYQLMVPNLNVVPLVEAIQAIAKDQAEVLGGKRP